MQSMKQEFPMDFRMEEYYGWNKGIKPFSCD